MTDAELDADIERMLTVHRNRKTLGFSYFETSRPKGGKPDNYPKRVRPPRKSKPRQIERWDENADMLEAVLAMAVSGLAIRQARAERASAPLEADALAQVTAKHDHHSRYEDDISSACGVNGDAT